MKDSKNSFLSVVSFLVFGVLLIPGVAFAYIGPGAGFAFIGSGFVVFATGLLALATLLAWPFLWAIRVFRRRNLRPKVKRVVVVGLDGLDAGLTEELLEAGKLPNLSKLRDAGGYRRLGTTLPALSPVAWSTFQTGVNPGAHNIFDFLSRDKRVYIPTLASTETVTKWKRLFGFKLPFKKREVELTRKSTPFWKILGKHGVFSNIIRVPISYPPEKFSGTILSAMCTPDIRGTQGTFSFFSTRPGTAEKVTGGERRPLSSVSNEARVLEGNLIGPDTIKGGEPAKVPFTLTPRDGESALLKVQGQEFELKRNVLSEWVKVSFHLGGRKKASALVRFCLRECGDEVTLYTTPLNCDPEKPALPIAYPIYFASWLAKKIGPFGTLGFAEDTWGRNEHAISDQIFLDQAFLTHAEREQMFFEALKRTRDGVLACVFDATDRIQHMFWRYIDPDHPSPLEDKEQFGPTIENLYVQMDEMVGKVQGQLNDEDALVVLSDHGFASFRRGINLNNWLRDNGYLVLKEGTTGERDYLQDVDWSKTRAYCIGLTGIYLNRVGREADGIVADNEVAALTAELREKLLKLKDPKCGSPCVRQVYEAEKAYRGLYKSEAPDIILGYEKGYRVSWDAVTGAMEPETFCDNVKAWSGDHHVDPSLVPGVLFSNREIRSDTPHLKDLAPSILDLFGLKAPGYMEGGAIL